MLVDVRTYTIKPGCTAAWLEIYERMGFPIQQRHIGQPLCYLQAETGELNTLVHCWVYESAADREQRRGAMAKDPEWQKFLKASRESGYIVSQRNSQMTPVKFAPIKR